MKRRPLRFHRRKSASNRDKGLPKSRTAVDLPAAVRVSQTPMLFTRAGHGVALGDMYRGATAFLVCGGPSLVTHDLTLLQRRGVLTLAVNNAAAVVRPNLWCSVDDPGHFCEQIWRDPGILKFVPLGHLEKPFLVRNAAEKLVPSTETVGDMPAVFGFRRNEDFVAERWLFEDSFNWGNHGKKVDAYGHKGSRSVMYVALKLLFYLGVRRVYLLGCDFKMEQGKQNYAFEQARSPGSVRGNNRSYEVLNVRLGHLRAHFEAAGFQVLNCTPNSGLTVFPYVSYEQAIEQATATMPKSINTRGMYDGADKVASAIADKVAGTLRRAVSAPQREGVTQSVKSVNHERRGNKLIVPKRRRDKRRRVWRVVRAAPQATRKSTVAIPSRNLGVERKPIQNRAMIVVPRRTDRGAPWRSDAATARGTVPATMSAKADATIPPGGGATNVCNEYAALVRRGFKDYSLGHRRMYTVPIALLQAGGAKYSIVDVGCGIGYGLDQMLRAGIVGRYTGIEPVSDSYRYVQEKFGDDPRVRLVNADWLAIDEAELRPADYVFCIEVVEHLPEALVAPFLEKLARFSRRNLFLSTPDAARSRHGTRTTDQWRAAFNEAGLNAVPLGNQWTTLYACEPRRRFVDAE